MNETYQQPGRWHDIILTETANSRINNDDASERIMSHQLHGLEASSIYEAIVQAKNRYGWSTVRTQARLLPFYCMPSKLFIQLIGLTYWLASHCKRRSRKLQQFILLTPPLLCFLFFFLRPGERHLPVLHPTAFDGAPG